jgi:uncharacterized protein YbjT (DUF2867 family)
MLDGRKIIAVAGATGNQGGAVARKLLDSGTWKVRALTRDPNQPAARELATRGAEIVRADLDDHHSIGLALDGAYGAFSVQNFWKVGYDREVYQGKTFADAAEAAGVKVFIYSSVGGADRNTGLPHFESKWEIENHLRMLDLRSTIFRPVFWMDNFNTPAYQDSLLDGTLAMGLRPTTRLQMIAVEDIGAFVAMAFDHPQDFVSVALEIAGDELTMPEAADIFGQVIGRPVEFVELSLEHITRANEEWGKMLGWFNERGYRADLPALRAMHPGLLTFEQWLRRAGWAGMGLRQAA